MGPCYHTFRVHTGRGWYEAKSNFETAADCPFLVFAGEELQRLLDGQQVMLLLMPLLLWCCLCCCSCQISCRCSCYYSCLALLLVLLLVPLLVLTPSVHRPLPSSFRATALSRR